MFQELSKLIVGINEKARNSLFLLCFWLINGKIIIERGDNVKEFIECSFCASEVVIENSSICEVCGDLFCRECIRENEIGEDVCYKCVEVE